MNKVKFVLFAAGISLAFGFVFSCSSGENKDNEPANSCSVAPADAPVLGGVFTDRDKLCQIRNKNEICAAWLSDDVKIWANDYLFKPGNVTEFLPVPKEKSAGIDVSANYPGSRGIVFVISDFLHNEVNLFFDEDECRQYRCKTKDGKPLTKENIAEGMTMHASAHYGNVAHRDSVVANCTDKIFQTSTTSTNCLSNEYNFYLAWDLKDNNDKYVKAGTYKTVTKGYWQIEYIDATGKLNSKKIGQFELTDTYEIPCWSGDDGGQP